MRSLWDSGIRRGDGQLLLRAKKGQSVDSQEDDRSLAAVMREIARSLAGCLFFVVAVQLLLHGSRFL